MKPFFLLVGAILISAHCFANPIPPGRLDKGSPQLKALSSSWKVARSLSPKKNDNDITMVYGGKDISLRPSIIPSTAAV